MAGIWTRSEETREGKFPIVIRRDGTVVEWPHMVLGWKDPATPAALRAYAAECERLGMDPVYVGDCLALADEAEAYRARVGEGDPDAPRHRKDDPLVISWARMGASCPTLGDIIAASNKAAVSLLEEAVALLQAPADPDRVAAFLDRYRGSHGEKA